MSNKIKKISIIVMVLLMSIIIFSRVYARDPNSSKGYADYDEEAAQKETEKLVEQQRNTNINVNELKSNNNYIKNLEIEGYEIYPEFAKEITDYNLKIDNKVDEINIIAIAEDSKSTIEGIGKTKLKEGQNIHTINVTAESGAMRTYLINIEKVKTEKTEDKDVKEENINSEILNENVEIANNIVKNNFIIILLFTILLIVIIIFMAWNKYKIKKGKNGKSKKINKKNLTKEVILYVVFGIFTTVVNLGTFYIMNSLLHWDENISNFIAIILAVLFAYITNKDLVFHSNAKGIKNRVIQFIKFIIGRAFTMVVEFVGGILLFQLPIPNIITKALLTIIVIILNFFISKFFAFKNNNKYNQ